MQQHELRQPAGATHRRKRVGRGNASGHGTYSTRGMKGQKARAGGGVRPGFEGGQLPLVRRMAYKRGFRSPFRVDYEEVNVGQLSRFPAGTEVTASSLADARIVRRRRKPVKVLGDGALAVALTVEATSFTASARSKIVAAGGSVRWLNGDPSVAERPETKRTKRAAAATAKGAQRREAAAAAKAAPTEKPAKREKGTEKKPAAQGKAAGGAKQKRERVPKATAAGVSTGEEPAPSEAGEEEAGDGTGS